MRNVFRWIAVSALCALCLNLCGCSLLEFDIRSQLVPPMATGDEEAIEAALEAFIATEFGSGAVEQYKLKYPREGEHRTAFILQDVDGDAVAEAVALYTLADEQGLTHVNYLRKCEDDTWESLDDFESESVDAREVRFADLDGDGRRELLIGWEYGMARDSRLSLYRLTSLALQEIGSYWYTEMLVAPIRKQSTEDVLLLRISSTDYEVSAQLLSMQNGEPTECGHTQMDGYIEDFGAIQIAALDAYTVGIYVDGIKENGGMVTELLCYDGTDLTAPLYDAVSNLNERTARESGLASMDIDADGQIEWPKCEQLPLAVGQAGGAVWLSRWCAWDIAERSEVTKLYGVTVSEDGYHFRVDETWLGALSAAYDAESHTLVIASKRGDAEQTEMIIHRRGVGTKAPSLPSQTTAATTTGTGSTATAVQREPMTAYKTVTLKGSGTVLDIWCRETPDSAFSLQMSEIFYRLTAIS